MQNMILLDKKFDLRYFRVLVFQKQPPEVLCKQMCS